MKKTILVCILTLLCILLCACETTTPAETSTAEVTITAAPVVTTAITTTAPIETTTAVTTTAPILSTEPQTVTVHTGVSPRLDWITNLANGFRHDYTTPTATFTYTLPSGWVSDDRSVASHDYVTLDKKQYISLYDLNEIGTQSALPPFSVYEPLGATCIETVESNDLRIDIYEYTDPKAVGYTFYMRGYIRVQDKYALRFEYETDENVTDDLINILQTVTLVALPEKTSKNAADVQIHEELRTVRIDNLIAIVEEQLPYGVSPEELPEEMYIEIDLPASWELLPTKTGETDIADVFYTELGMPGSGISPDKCLYQAFHSWYLSIEETADLHGTEGTSASGNKYWLLENTIDDYHAVEYNVCVQLSDKYFYDFELCVDKDNTELVYQVIDSVKLCETETNGFQYYQISMLPWLRDFCNAQNGRGDMFGIIFKRPKDTKTYLHYSAYETTMKALDTTDCFAYLRMAFPEATFSDTDVQSAQTTDGTVYLYFKEPDADAYRYYFAMIPYPNQLLCGAVKTEAANAREAFLELVDSIQVDLDEECYSEEDIPARHPNLSAELVSVNFTSALHETEYTFTCKLPTNWERFSRDFSDAVYYGEFGKPVLYPHTVYEHCPYQAFRFDGLSEGSLTVDDTMAWQYPEKESGQTSSGVPYIVYSAEIPEYHAIEYRVYAQVKENMVASFMLCVDADNNDLLKTVIDSVSLGKN